MEAQAKWRLRGQERLRRRRKTFLRLIFLLTLRIRDGTLTNMKSVNTVSIRVPVTPNERTALAGVAKSLGLSTHAFARLLFAYSIADIRPIANYLRECRKRQAKTAQRNSR